MAAKDAWFQRSTPKSRGESSPPNLRGIFKGVVFKFSSGGSRGFCGSRGVEREKRTTPFLNNPRGPPHKELGLRWGPLHSLCGYFFMCLFRFLFLPAPLPALLPDFVRCGFCMRPLGS